MQLQLDWCNGRLLINDPAENGGDENKIFSLTGFTVRHYDSASHATAPKNEISSLNRLWKPLKASVDMIVIWMQCKGHWLSLSELPIIEKRTLQDVGCNSDHKRHPKESSLSCFEGVDEWKAHKNWTTKPDKPTSSLLRQQSVFCW